MTFTEFLQPEALGLIASKAALVLVAGSLVSICVRRCSASIRHAVWVATLAGTVLLPLTVPFAPRLPILPLGEASIVRSQIVKRPVHPAVPVTPPATAHETWPASDSIPAAVHQAPAGPSLASMLLLLWGVGFALLALRSLMGLQVLRALGTFATRPHRHEDLYLPLGDRIGIAQPWSLRQALNAEPASALTWGLVHPVVLLPNDSDRWSESRLESVLLHELAHVRRRDFAWQLVGEFACALYWFNPLVWYAVRSMRAAAESAADDAVLGAGIAPTEYASELLRIAAEIGRRRLPLLQPGLPTMNPTKIESRLQSVLSPDVRRRGLTTFQALLALGGACVGVPFIAGIQTSATPAQAMPRPANERTEALSRVKMMGLATIMYANDYDDYFPYAQQTASVVGVTAPYVKNMKMFESPTPGGKFVFNLNVGGVPMSSLDVPAEIPLWREILPDPQMRAAVVFCDGHAKLFGPEKMPSINAAAKRRFPRPAKSKPLPKNYMVKR